MSKLAVIVFIIFLMGGRLNAQQTTTTMNAAAIIEKAIEAHGGRDYLLTIKTLYTDCTTTTEGRPVHWIIKEMLPNKGSFAIVYNGFNVYQNWFDGKQGYEIINGRKKKAGKEDFSNKPFKRNIFNELDYADTSLWKLELVGSEPVNNEICYKVSARLVNGMEELLYYSSQSFLMLKKEVIKGQEKDRHSVFYFSGYKQFGRLVYFTKMEMPGGGGVQTVVTEKLLMNAEVTEDDFR